MFGFGFEGTVNGTVFLVRGWRKDSARLTARNTDVNWPLALGRSFVKAVAELI
jgi:hypothetical protein